MKKKSGLTLIELLAIIVLLGVISLIAFPSIISIISDTEDELSEANKLFIIEQGKNFVNDNINTFFKTNGNVYCVMISELRNYNYLSDSFMENLTDNQKVSAVEVSVVGDNYVYKVIDKCTPIMTTNITYTVTGNPFNEVGWAKTNVEVIVSSGDEVKNINWCLTSDISCVPTSVSLNNFTATITASSATNKICAQTVDNNDQTSGIICSENYKIDKIMPEITPKSAPGVESEKIPYSEIEEALAKGNEEFSSPVHTEEEFISSSKILKHFDFVYGPSGAAINCTAKFSGEGVWTESYAFSCQVNSNSGLENYGEAFFPRRFYSGG